MTMLLLILRQSLDQDLQLLVKELNAKSCTKVQKVFGMGAASTASNPMTRPGSDCTILAAVEDGLGTHVVERLREFRDWLTKQLRIRKLRSGCLHCPVNG